MSALIQVKNLKKSFKIFKRNPGLKGAVKSFFNRQYEELCAVKNCSFDVDKGEIIGILGENGAGKTTLIKMMVGLLHPTSGSLLINNYNPWERKNQFLKNISIVMGQKNQLWWDIPASESFLLNKSIYNISDRDYNTRMNELVDLLGVREKLNIQVRRLSLGERMKMEIIAALLHNPSIVFLDEPTLGLDVISQSKIRDFIRKYNRENKTTFIITSHYIKDIQELCERVYVIHKGKELYDGNFNELIKKINPKSKLSFEFNEEPNQDFIKELKNTYNISLINNQLFIELEDDKIKNLLTQLLRHSSSRKFSIEELPVEEAMKAFFTNPDLFL
ncbi:MAG: hypothetical protein CMG59_06940 [Candidatus Marinimicrobia bacterium]|nr:hypothetical protein [Candidatus Neomarinimicrobiota bacterium]|tara:strand:+ start:891 stop:1886 length:996 start_codon:yes stop_codon:yes gene_type:complete